MGETIAFDPDQIFRNLKDSPEFFFDLVEAQFDIPPDACTSNDCFGGAFDGDFSIIGLDPIVTLPTVPTVPTNPTVPSPTAVPLPATLPMLGLGVLAMLGFRRKRT